MQKQIGNFCVRCGKERVVVKVWSEVIGTSVVKYSLANCPDILCQKIVDKNNLLREEKQQFHLLKRQQAKLPRK